MSFLHDAVVYLGAAVIAVPIFKRIGLGSVLGYLAAGVVIGPSGVALVGDVESVLHFAEFGVVLLLFLIGLELEPSRLWAMRGNVFGLGGIQVGVTSIVLGGAAWMLGVPPVSAVVIGLALSLSSTAFALQLLSEKNQVATEHGRRAFGILLFQDLAVIPVLAVLPLLGGNGPTEIPWLRLAAVAGVLAGLVLASRWVLRPLLKLVASTRIQELFTASALLVVVGTALLMEEVGLSMALGAFVAGVLLADSEFKHELEADIEPFKGLLLGLFFIAVGMSVNLGVLASKPVAVLLLVAGLVAVKAVVLYPLGKGSGCNRDSSFSLALVASQGGEFAFVLFGFAAAAGILAPELRELLIVVVSVSMAATPILLAIYERMLRPRLVAAAGPAREFDRMPDEESAVIIAGFGRVGQVVGRVLRAKKIRYTALDASSEHVDFIQKFGNKIYYGDASRLDLLRAAHADRARIFVLAIDDVAASLRTAETVQKHFPHLKIFARARNRQHAYKLLDMGVERIFRETLGSSLEMTGEILQAAGLTFSESHSTLERFRQYDENLLQETFKHHRDVDKLRELANKASRELEELFDKDARAGRGAA